MIGKATFKTKSCGKCFCELKKEAWAAAWYGCNQFVKEKAGTTNVDFGQSSKQFQPGHIQLALGNGLSCLGMYNISWIVVQLGALRQDTFSLNLQLLSLNGRLNYLQIISLSHIHGFEKSVAQCILSQQFKGACASQMGDCLCHTCTEIRPKVLQWTWKLVAARYHDRIEVCLTSLIITIDKKIAWC